MAQMDKTEVYGIVGPPNVDVANGLERWCATNGNEYALLSVFFNSEDKASSIETETGTVADQITHDWRMRIDGYDYGLLGLKEYATPHHRTVIYHNATYPGYRVVDLRIHFVALILIGIGSVPPLIIAYFYARHRRRNRNAA